MASIYVDVDIEDYLDEVSTKDLIEELDERGYTVIEGEDTTDNSGKCPTDIWKDECIAQAYHELSWEEWEAAVNGALAKKKGGKK